MVSLLGREWTRAELLKRVGRLEQIAGVELIEAGDGMERGVRILRVKSGGGFEFDILIDRGFDIGRASMNGKPMAWWSPVGLVGPWFYEPTGLGWFRAFAGGLLSTCGLDHTLLGGVDESTEFNFPHRKTETYGLHGRYSGLAAKFQGYGVEWSGDEATIWAEGEIVQATIFGEQLRLHRRIEVPMGGKSVLVKDEVTNIGSTSCPHMMLYHCNIGFPVVDDGSELIYPSGEGVCVSDSSSPNYQKLTPPTTPFVEECYEHDMATDKDGWVSAAVINRAAGIGVYQKYLKKNLPHHITWRQLGEATYVVAMEPSTNHDIGRFDARKNNELIHLAPGETRSYQIELGALAGKQEIDSFIDNAQTQHQSRK